MLIGRSAIDAGNTEAYMVLIETCFTMFQSDPLSEQLVRDHGPGSFNRLCDTIPTG